MPGIFYNPSTDRVFQWCRKQPIPNALIVLDRLFLYLFLRSSKLRTARDTNCLWNVATWEELFKGLLVKMTRMSLSLGWVYCIFERADLGRATQNPYTAQVEIPFLLEVRYAKLSQNRQAVIVGIVVVPLVSLRVEKENVCWQFVVVVDDETKLKSVPAWQTTSSRWVVFIRKIHH